MSSQPTGEKPGQVHGSPGLQDDSSSNTKTQVPSDETPEQRQPGGFPAVGKAMAPLTQPVNYAVKGTTRAVNGAVGVTTSVANGLVLGTTGVLGTTAEAALPKGVFGLSEAQI
jgi:hypothetical protein